MQLKKMHNDIYQSKKINFNKLYEIIKPGSRLFLSSGPAMPICTVEQMIKSDATSLQDLEIIQLITLGDYLKTGEHQYKYRLKTFKKPFSFLGIWLTASTNTGSGEPKHFSTTC